MEDKILYRDEAYKIIGICMEIHNILGKGDSEVVYKDALEYEFNSEGIDFERENQFKIEYKNIILPHYYFADFVALKKIILEIKAIESLTNSHIKQTFPIGILWKIILLPQK